MVFSTASEPIYSFPYRFLPLNPIVPFTYRDGNTFIEALQTLRAWLVDELLPAINSGMEEIVTKIDSVIEELETAVQHAEASASTAEAAKVLAQQALADVQAILTTIEEHASDVAADRQSVSDALASINATKAAIDAIAAGLSQDSIVNAIVTNESSESRQTLDTLYKLTPSEVIGLVDEDIGRTGLGTLYGRIHDFFVARPKSSDVAVTIGSSNAADSTQNVTGMVAARLGVRDMNFAIGGGAFHNGNFNLQLTNARDSPAFDNADVRWVFVVDASNDIRAKVNTTATEARTVFNNIRDWFPNARMVVVPVLWPPNEFDFPAEYGGWQREWRSIINKTGSMLRAFVHEYKGAVYCDYSWTWHADNDAYQVPGEVHFTAFGRVLSADKIMACIDGADTRIRSIKEATPSSGEYGTGYYGGAHAPLTFTREGDTISAYGHMTKNTSFGPLENWYHTHIEFAPVGLGALTAHHHNSAEVVPIEIYSRNQNRVVRLAASGSGGELYRVSGTYNWAM